jgi:tRNA U34 5-carboxymethylaminomethyl modifying enzyme MnmG/GidA
MLRKGLGNTSKAGKGHLLQESDVLANVSSRLAKQTNLRTKHLNHADKN